MHLKKYIHIVKNEEVYYFRQTFDIFEDVIDYFTNSTLDFIRKQFIAKYSLILPGGLKPEKDFNLIQNNQNSYIFYVDISDELTEFCIVLIDYDGSKELFVAKYEDCFNICKEKIVTHISNNFGIYYPNFTLDNLSHPTRKINFPKVFLYGKYKIEAGKLKYYPNQKTIISNLAISQVK